MNKNTIWPVFINKEKEMENSTNADEQVTVSLFNSRNAFETDVVSEELTVSFEQLAENITKYSWSPSVFKYVTNFKTKKGKHITGNHRTKENFKGTKLLTFDVDEGLTIQNAIAECNNLNLKYHIAATKNHQKQKGNKPPCDRFRIVFELSREITNNEDFDCIWIFYSKNFNVDKSCKDSSRFYFPCTQIINSNLSMNKIDVDTILVNNSAFTKKYSVNKQTSKLNVDKGQLSKKTKDFIKNGRNDNENWHERFFKAATDLREQNYSIEEARELLTQATKSELGHLDSTDEDQLKDIYTRDNRYLPRKSETTKTISQADQLLSYTENISLYQSLDGEMYLENISSDTKELLLIESESTKKMLMDLYYQNSHSLPDDKSIEKVMKMLSFKASKKNKVSINYRIAKNDLSIVIDRGAKTDTFIVVTEHDWKVQSVSTEKFSRNQNMKELPLPAKGNIESLKKFLNLNSEDDFILLIAFLINCFFKGKTNPILILQGPQGSGKSTLSELIKSLIDPSSPSLRALPYKEQDIFIAAKNSYLLTFDNLSGINIKMSDTLCKIATSCAIAGRRFYSNTEEYFIEVSRPIVINGIDDLTVRPDLVDRSIVLNLPKIDEKKRMQISKMTEDLNILLPSIFGAILDGISSGLRNISKINLSEKPRMADFSFIACASLSAFGYSQDQIMKAIRDNRKSTAIDSIESNSVGRAVITFMSDKPIWEGRVSDLAVILGQFLDREGVHYSLKTPNSISRELNRIAPELKFKNIYIEHSRKSHERKIIIKKISSLPSPPKISN